jgi:hypothetical protein
MSTHRLAPPPRLEHQIHESVPQNGLDWENALSCQVAMIIKEQNTQDVHTDGASPCDIAILRKTN